MFIVDDLINGWFGSQAANQQAQQAQKAMDLQQNTFGNSQSRLMPWMDAGQQSLAQLLTKMQAGGFDNNVNPQTLANDPGYQFRMQQGQQALQRSAAAKGGLNSGGFMKGLDQFSQGLASQQYQQAFQNQQTLNNTNFARLYQMSGMGQNAADSLGTLGQNYANSMGGLYGALGNAHAAGQQALGNAFSGSVRDFGNFATMAGGGMPSFGGGGGGGGNAPSASSLYDSNPGNYSPGAGNLIPTQGF